MVALESRDAVLAQGERVHVVLVRAQNVQTQGRGRRVEPDGAIRLGVQDVPAAPAVGRRRTRVGLQAIRVDEGRVEREVGARRARQPLVGNVAVERIEIVGAADVRAGLVFEKAQPDEARAQTSKRIAGRKAVAIGDERIAGGRRRWPDWQETEAQVAVDIRGRGLAASLGVDIGSRRQSRDAERGPPDGKGEARDSPARAGVLPRDAAIQPMADRIDLDHAGGLRSVADRRGMQGEREAALRPDPARFRDAGCQQGTELRQQSLRQEQVGLGDRHSRERIREGDGPALVVDAEDGQLGNALGGSRAGKRAGGEQGEVAEVARDLHGAGHWLRWCVRP
jgi:hypothetical protein